MRPVGLVGAQGGGGGGVPGQRPGRVERCLPGRGRPGGTGSRREHGVRCDDRPGAV
jgi:hypothetical protein